MNVSLDILPILDPYKTGVGWYTYNLIKNMANIKSKDEYKFEFLGFDFLGRRNNIDVKDMLKTLYPNCNYKIYKMMPYGIYRRIWDYLPIYYNNLFRSQSDIYHFFNFIVPPKIKGHIVNTVHDMVFKKFPNTMTKANYKRLEKNLKRSCDNSDIIITVSDNSKKEIMEYFNMPERKIRIVPNGVDLNFYKPIRNVNVIKKYKIEKPYFLYIGTLEPRKNIPNLIRAFNILLQKLNKKDIILVIGGRKGWRYDEIYKCVEELKLEDDVLFLGYVPIEDMPALYTQAISFVFPSLYEGFGIPPLEAMACGTPVIASNTSSLPEVVGDAGMLVNPYDIEELSNAMMKIYEDNHFREKLKSLSLDRSKQFTWINAANKLLEVYKIFK